MCMLYRTYIYVKEGRGSILEHMVTHKNLPEYRVLEDGVLGFNMVPPKGTPSPKFKAVFDLVEPYLTYY